MHCPFCNANDTKVVDSRLVGEGHQVRRRRECIACNERYTTYEAAELVMPMIIKKDGRRVPFDDQKMRSGIARALEKRPVSMEDLEIMLDTIKKTLRQTGEREVSSEYVGETVMSALRALDEVAYIRFASVYKRFKDISEFSKTIDRLQELPV